LGLPVLRPDDQVPFLDEPPVEFMGSMQAMGSTDRPDFFISGGFLYFLIQEHLDRAVHILAVFPALVFRISLHTRFLGKNSKKGFWKLLLQSSCARYIGILTIRIPVLLMPVMRAAKTE
jgi:hypothetical protein